MSSDARDSDAGISDTHGFHKHMGENPWMTRNDPAKLFSKENRMPCSRRCGEEVNVNHEINNDGGCGSSLEQEQLEAVSGGSLLSRPAEGIPGGEKSRAVHSICGTELTFRQIQGTYYCPTCKKEVPFNEILKGSCLIDSAGSRGVLS